MRDHHAATVGRRGVNGLVDLLVQLQQFLIVGTGTLTEAAAVGRRDLAQAFGDVGHIVANVQCVLPGVGIQTTMVVVMMAMRCFVVVMVGMAVAMGAVLVMIMAVRAVMIVVVTMRAVVVMIVFVGIIPMVVVIIRGLHGLQAPSGLDDRSLVATGTDQAGHPALEAQAVDDDQAGAGQLAHLGRPRLEDVGVAAGLDQALDSHAVTADLLHQVSQDAEAGHDGQGPARRGGIGLTGGGGNAMGRLGRAGSQQRRGQGSRGQRHRTGKEGGDAGVHVS